MCKIQLSPGLPIYFNDFTTYGKPGFNNWVIQGNSSIKATMIFWSESVLAREGVPISGVSFMRGN